MPKISISVVTYNSEKYLHDFCDSLHAQTFTDWELIAIDNASYDRSAAVVSECMPSAKVIRQKENIGFSKAHNLSIAWSKSEYVLVVNPDFIFEEHCLERLVRYADAHAHAGAVGPKLLSWDHAAHQPVGTIDSCGIQVKGPYRSSDIMQSEKNQATVSHRVFGLSGACVMFRRSALEAVKLPRIGGVGNEYFDEDFFLYKEDVDIAWRLNLQNCEQHLVGDAIAFHQRTIRAVSTNGNDGTEFSYMQELSPKNRSDRKKRSGINRYSYRNHLLTVYKNHQWRITLKKLPSVIWFETGKFFYLAFLDGSSPKGMLEFFQLLPKFKKKRRMIQKNKAALLKDMAQLLQ